MHPPRSLRPTGRGLFDLHGNLYEWTHDWSEDLSSEAKTDPLGPKRGSFRVFRGGSWDLGAAEGRTAFRFTSLPRFRSRSLGLRLALSLSGKPPEAEE